jgi:transcriptional regulator with XRE-family HTH domain
MLLAKRIKKIRTSKKLTQVDVAEIIGVTQPTYSEYENMAGNCAFYTLQKIAKALNVSVPFLVDIDNEYCLKEPESDLK